MQLARIGTPLQVYAENTIPVLIRHIVEVLKIYEASRPGVVDEDVQLAKRLDGLRDNSPAICIRSHVSLHHHRANAIAWHCSATCLARSAVRLQLIATWQPRLANCKPLPHRRPGFLP